MRFTIFVRVLLGASLLATPAVVGACGSHQSKDTKAELKPDLMPSGAVWEGVYFNAIWGHLHLKTSGNDFEGKWKRTDESAYGEMKGTLNGNIARFTWTEHTVGMVGPSGSRTGHGYFKYVRPEGENIDDRLVGEWGFGDAEIGGGEWDAVKQRNKEPNFDEVTADRDPSVGSWR